MFFFYEDDHDFVPYKYLVIPPMSSKFAAVCSSFQGRLVRGSPANLDGQKHLLGTWAEINWMPDGRAWGDISLLEGNDGAAEIGALEDRAATVIDQKITESDKTKGFTLNLLRNNTPAAAWAQKPGTGTWCVDRIAGAFGNTAAKEWEMQFLSPDDVYLTDDTNPVIDSAYGRFEVTFYEGAI